MIRLFVEHPLSAGAGIAPSADQVHYLLSVMRLKENERLLVFNGQDGEWRAAVTDVSKRSCRLTVETLTQAQPAPSAFELIIAMIKRPRLETVIEKAVELGAGRVQLALTQRSNVDRANLTRLQAIATEAAEQTGRLDIPEIAPPQKLEALLAAWPRDRALLFCDEAGEDPSRPWGGPDGRAGPALRTLLDAAASHDPRPDFRRDWAVLIGPEGGFSPQERIRLRSHPTVVPVSLGPRILRADTAAIAAMVLWQAVLGDWRGP